jgi:uncharacterized protein with GYD domain
MIEGGGKPPEFKRALTDLADRTAKAVVPTAEPVGVRVKDVRLRVGDLHCVHIFEPGLHDAHAARETFGVST